MPKVTNYPVKKSKKRVTMKATPKTKKTVVKKATTVKRKPLSAAKQAIADIIIAVIVAEPLPRYSDAKLAHFKVLLEQREEKERIELGFINSCLSSNIEHGGFSEDGSSVSSEKENLNLQRSRIITTLENISKAYSRIRDKSYGRCKTTNKLIDEARLRVHPWATQSMVAKMETKSQ